MSEAQQQEAIAAAMQKAQETIMAQQKQQQEMQAQYQQQMEKMQQDMLQQKQQLEDIQKVKNENAAQLEKVRQEQQQAAAANKQRMLQQLNATLNTIGSTHPGQSVVLPQPPQGEAAKDAAKQSEYEAKLMDTTISTMQQLQQQNTSANMEARNHKRTATEALAAGYNFHTGGSTMPPPSQVGTVNCSAEEAKKEAGSKRFAMDPTKDKQTVLGEMMREWYQTSKQSNQAVDYNTCARQFDAFEAQLRQPGVMGTVNASKGGLWSSSSLTEGNPVSTQLCMQHMQPELFGEITRMNPGRIITPQETRELMATIQPAQAMPMR